MEFLCPYCGLLILDASELPEQDIDWEIESLDHAPDCLWLTTKAFSIDLNTTNFVPHE